MSKLFDLSGKVALVTGGNGGLGMAEALASCGASIAIWGTNTDKNAAALTKLRAHGVSTEAWVCNVTNREADFTATAEVLDRFGRIDGCFAHAGVSRRGAKSFL